MSIVVQKFGGSSIENNEKLFNICKFITKEYDKNNKVVVIVSAQGNTTDNLIKEAKEIDENIDKRELDVLMSVGEQIAGAKLAMCLKKVGYDAISLTGWQIPIKTNNIYGNADIIKINLDRIIKELDDNKIVIITGFQGITEENDITTLGRGGSDTTAIAIAAALKADKCDIYKDVDGIYNIDPKINKKALKYDKISYNEMLVLAHGGAKVLHEKSVKLAKKFTIPIHIKSVYNENSIGTYINNY